jgi:hypothetical protein
VDKLREKAIAAGIDQKTTIGREFLDLIGSLDLGVMLDFKLTIKDGVGREEVYSSAVELDKMIPFGRGGGTTGWMMTTGLTAADGNARRAELLVKRWR